MRYTYLTNKSIHLGNLGFLTSVYTNLSTYTSVTNIIKNVTKDDFHKSSNIGNLDVTLELRILQFP